MQQFTGDTHTQIVGCSIIRRVLCDPDGVMRVCEVNGGFLVCSALRVHMSDAAVASCGCSALSEMLKQGLESTIDATAASQLAEAACRSHPADAAVQKIASDLVSLLLEFHPTPSIGGVSPVDAALHRVAEVKECHDFASHVRDMDAFPECEELQVAGCNAFVEALDAGDSENDASAAGAIGHVRGGGQRVHVGERRERGGSTDGGVASHNL